MKTLKQLFTLAILTAIFVGCINEQSNETIEVRKSSRPAWYDEHPMAGTEADFSVISVNPI